MTDLEYPFTPCTKNDIACGNSNFRTPGSQKLKLVTRCCEKQDLAIQDIYLLSQKQRQRFVEKFNKAQPVSPMSIAIA